MATGDKAPGAFKTIGELSSELGVAQHILRYWESRFPQLKPLQRAGNRRYYRPADVDLARRIHRLLNEEGYTVRGVQQLLKSKAGGDASGQDPEPPERQQPEAAEPTLPSGGPATPAIAVDRLIALRNELAEALGD